MTERTTRGLAQRRREVVTLKGSGEMPPLTPSRHPVVGNAGDSAVDRGEQFERKIQQTIM
jgi:hypothetical protein